MSAADLTGWTGLDLTPLPFESSYSVLTRFAFQNVLKPSHLYNALFIHRKYFREYSFLDLVWLCENHVLQDPKWTLPSADERACGQSFKNAIRVFFTPFFRFCPLCLQCGYHSCFHQCSSLRHCPLHNCLITLECQTCGGPTTIYSFSKELFACPYYCHLCHGPLSGVAPVIDDHIDLRNDTCHLSNAFLPLSEWIHVIGSRYQVLSDLVTHNRLYKEWDVWCDPSNFLHSLAHKMTPLPSVLCPAPLHQITVIKWRVQMQVLGEKYGQDMGRVGKRRKTIKAVYMVVLRKLQLWINSMKNKVTSSRNLILANETEVNIRNDLEIKELAYLFLRRIFEHDLFFSLEKGIEPTGFYLDYFRAYDIYSTENREPRLAWYAIFMGAYATLHTMVNRVRKNDLVDLRRLNTTFNNIVPRYFFVEKENYYSGAVAFLSIPDFPYAISRKVKLR